MPNWVINCLEFIGDDAIDIINKHLTINERGEKEFDFNTIIKMPEELKIEKSSRSSDGFKLYIAKMNPFITNIGDKEDKLTINQFMNKLVNTFNRDCIDHIERYILREKEIIELKEKYKDKLKDLVVLGEKVFHNYELYKVADWYDWSIKFWGCKWNSCNTIIEGNKVYFDTPWSPSIEVVSELAKMHYNIKIIHEYAEEQTGFYSGIRIYEHGYLKKSDDYEPFSRAAYEMSFKLWKNEDEYRYNSETRTYEYINTDDNNLN